MSVVDADLRQLAAWLDSNVQEVTDVVDDRLHDEVPEYFEGIDPGMAEAERASVTANLRAVAHGLDTAARCLTACRPARSTRRCWRPARGSRGGRCCAPRRHPARRDCYGQLLA